MAAHAPAAFGFGVNQCAASRAGSSLNCTANDVSIASVTVTNGVVECTAGQMVTLNLSLNVQSNASTRYDIGVFLASDGKDPSILPGSGGSSSCNVSALPTTAPFLNSNSNGCGDISSSVGLASFTMNSIDVLCEPDALGKLRIDSVVTWQQNSSGTPTCSGANDVTAGGPSKCSTGIAAEINVNVKGGLTVIKKTAPSGSPQLFAFSASGASASPTSFNLSDGGQQVISTGNLTTAPQSLQVVESATPGWVPTAITCIDANGNPNPAYVITNPATGAITANLSIANPSATCTVTNTQSPSLTLVKQVVNTNGGAATAGQWTLQAAGPTTISGASGSAAVTGATVPAGTYTLSESGGPAGYSASAWTCTNNVAVTNSQITLGNGASTTCTITNSDQPATLTLVKQVTNTNGGTATAANWTLQAAGPTTISGVSGAAAVTGAAVPAGTYTLSESSGPAGYSASVWTCTNNVTVSGGQIALGNGVNTTCTITNSDQAARLTLVKQVVNNNGGTAIPTNWTLHAAGPISISGTTGAAAVTAAAVPAGTYTLSESGGLTGYSASAWSCTNNVGVSGGQITLGNGVSTTCTITNSDQPAVLTLVKQVVNTNGGAAVATNWTLQAAGPTTISGVTGAAAVTAAAVSAGTYVLSESGGPTGYTAIAWSCTNSVAVTGGQITLGNGVSTTCTITNSDQPATLTLIKQVVNTNGGVAAAGNWTLQAAGPATISGATGAAAVTSAAVPAGSYTLSESGGPTGYTASAWTCTNNVSVTSGQITLGNGVNTTCTITNSDQPAILTLVKQVVNTNGGTAIATNWTLQAAGPATISGATGAAAVTGAAVPAGTYTLSESGGPAGYSASAWTCTNNVTVAAGQITLGNGVSTTCTITNNDLAATLTLVKQVVNTNGGAAVATNWTLQAAGPTTISGATGAAAVTAAAVPAGTYALSESGGPAGYTASAWSCTNNITVTAGQITLGNGVSTTCTITNSDQPAILTLVKQVVNTNGGVATAGNWTLHATGPASISGASGAAAVTGAAVPAGVYTLSESGGPAGYTASAWACTNNVVVTNGQITLGNGISTICTITNSDQPAVLTLVKQVVNTNGGAAVAANWTLEAAGPATISGATGAPAVTAAAVPAGTYALSESGGPAGYTPSAWACTNNVAVTGGQITLGNGVSTTCTITNSDQPAILTLVKQVVNTNGGAAVATNWMLQAAGPTTISGATGAPAVTAAAVSAGTYALSESGGPAGYTASVWTCTNNVAVTGSQITLGNGVSTTCTITNSDQPAILTLIKQVVNTNGGVATAGNWTLHAAGPATISGATGAATVTAAAIPAGTYALSESGGPAGYSASVWTCTNNVTVSAGQITLGNGVSTTCTITNSDQAATLTLVKQVVNTNGGTATVANWTLQAAGPTTISGTTGATAVTSAPVPAGTYTLSESGGPAGYAASVWTCTNNVSVNDSQITLGNGVSTTCTITNNDLAATLTLVKQVVNTHGGTATANNWTLQAAGPTTISGTVGAAAITAAAVPAGTYMLSESGGPAGYTASAWACTNNVAVSNGQITLGNGVSSTCTIINSDQAAALTLVKQVVNSNGGAATAANWTLEAVGPATISGATGTAAVTAAPVPAGTYTLSESGGPTGYTASAWTCTNNVTVTGGQITLGNGASTTCTIVNSDQAAILTLVKEVVNTNGGVAVASNWTLQAAGPATISGTTGAAAVTSAAVPAGTYTLSESGGPAGYSPSAWTCTNNVAVTNGQITLGNGVSTTCTITNSDLAATLTLIKQVVNNHGGAAAAVNWTLHAVGPTTISGATGAAAVTAAAVPAGTYTLTETGGPAGYSASAWSCTNNVTVANGQIALANGVNTTCTITNSDQAATLTLVKHVVNTNGGAAIPDNWMLQAAGPTTISGATGSVAVTAAAVSAGTYTLSESGGPAGYTASVWTCTNNVTVTNGQIALGNGVNTTCTITNSDQAAILTLIKQVVNTNGGTAAADEWMLKAAGPATISGMTGTAAVTAAAVPAGTYALSESGGPAGYTASAWTCTNNIAVANGQITLGNGANTTCTITNSDQPATLTLVKQVVNTNGGTATATQWTLHAVGPATVSGATGAAAVTAAAVPAGTYTLSESGGPAGYTASAWTCTNNVAVNNGQITLGNGASTTCTITNSDQPATLTLVKQVANTHGGSAAAAAWILQAAGPSTISGMTGSTAVTAATVAAGTYALSETGGPAGYAASAWTCTNDVAVSDSQIVLSNGANTTCTITNSDQPATITLIIQVINTNGGTATAGNWVAQAAGPTTISGATGSASVTVIPVPLGTYTLTGSGGPPGYTAGTWTCTNSVTVTNGQITLGSGVTTVCTIVYSDQPATLTLVKHVANVKGGKATPTSWTLHATGPVTISGVTGTAAVTAAALPVGTYALSESDGPPGYAASAWTCTNGVTVSDSRISLGNGTSTTCTITNSDTLVLPGPVSGELVPTPMLPPWALALLGLIVLGFGMATLRRHRR